VFAVLKPRNSENFMIKHVLREIHPIFVLGGGTRVQKPKWQEMEKDYRSSVDFSSAHYLSSACAVNVSVPKDFIPSGQIEATQGQLFLLGKLSHTSLPDQL
jgi:hypothetical protein